MTSLFCIEYIAVVPGLDPGTHDKPDVAVLALVSQPAHLRRNARKAASFHPISAS
jgi:hypothetical protein